MISASKHWKEAFPGASIGVLAMGRVANPETTPALEARKAILEADLRSAFASFSRNDLRSHPSIAPYTDYYKRFNKTYHVQHQLESIVFKGKRIPRGAALVEAMFMAELKNLLLTAGHDLDAVRGEIVIDLATGTETYLTLSRKEQTLKQSDMFIRDEAGILSSIIYGPDHRTRITSAITRVLFTAYAPSGTPEEKVRHHLNDLTEFVKIVSPNLEVEHSKVVSAKPCT